MKVQAGHTTPHKCGSNTADGKTTVEQKGRARGMGGNLSSTMKVTLCNVPNPSLKLGITPER
eukprot:8695408-Prorocentrum_lima.AAC.1